VRSTFPVSSRIPRAAVVSFKDIPDERTMASVVAEARAGVGWTMTYVSLKPEMMQTLIDGLTSYATTALEARDAVVSANTYEDSPTDLISFSDDLGTSCANLTVSVVVAGPGLRRMLRLMFIASYFRYIKQLKMNGVFQ